VTNLWEEVHAEMENFTESAACAMTRGGATLPARGAFLPGVGRGHVVCATPGLPGVKGTRMPWISLVQAQKLVFEPTPTRNPYTDKTRAAAIGGGAKGPHPLREPEPV
jgi:hypothetical protein